MGWVAVSATAHPAATQISALALLLHPRPTPAAPPDTAAKPQPVPASASKRRVPRITRKTSPPETVRQATNQAVPGSQSTQHKAGEWEGDAGTKNPPLEQRLRSTTSPGPSTCANPSGRNSQDATAPRRGPRQVCLCPLPHVGIRGRVVLASLWWWLQGLLWGWTVPGSCRPGCGFFGRVFVPERVDL